MGGMGIGNSGQQGGGGLVDLSTGVTGVLPPQNGGTGVANNSASTITISGSFGTTFTVSALTSVTLPTSGTLYGTAVGSISSAQLLSSMSDETGTGALVFANTPTLVTPALGAATATSINGLTITSTTGTFTLTNAKTLAVSDSYTLATNAITIGNGAVLTFGTRNNTFTNPNTADALFDIGIGASATTQGALMLQIKPSQTKEIFNTQNEFGAPIWAYGPAGQRRSYGSQFVGVAPATPTFSSASRTASTTCVITTAAAHTIPVGAIVNITGSSIAAYNGTWPVSATTSTTFSYICNSSATDAPTGIVILPLGINQFGGQVTATDSTNASAVSSRFLADNIYVPTGTGKVIHRYECISGFTGWFQIGTNFSGTNVWTVDYTGALTCNGSISCGGSTINTTLSGATIRLGSLGIFGMCSTATGGTIDTGISRGGAALIVAVGNGTSTDTSAFLVDHRTIVATNTRTTQDDTTLTTDGTLTRTLLTGKSYRVEFYIPITQGTVLADQLAWDLNGGTATMTSMDITWEVIDGTALASLTNANVTALNTLTTMTASANAKVILIAHGSITTSGAGTFIPRYKKVADVGTGFVRNPNAVLTCEMTN